jgi:hypothetical protein
MIDDYSSPRDAYIFTGPIPPPTMWPMGEIHHADGTTQLIPQPVRWDERTRVNDDGLTVTGVVRAIDKASQMPAERRSAVPRVPLWSLACIACGLVLVAIGLVARDPVARAVWEAIQG